MERSEKKQKRSEKLLSFSLRSEIKQNGSEKLRSFSLRSEMKRNRSEKMPSFSLRSEMEATFFSFNEKKVFFSLVSHLKRKENEIKRKQSKKTFISFRIEAKRKDWKRDEAKRKKFGSETKRKYALLISLWSEAKNSKRNKAKKSEKTFFFSRERAKRMRNGSRFASFRFEAKHFFFAKPAHPNLDLAVQFDTDPTV
jgi:hypothetical protein